MSTGAKRAVIVCSVAASGTHSLLDGWRCGATAPAGDQPQASARHGAAVMAVHADGVIMSRASHGSRRARAAGAAGSPDESTIMTWRGPDRSSRARDRAQLDVAHATVAPPPDGVVDAVDADRRVVERRHAIGESAVADRDRQVPPKPRHAAHANGRSRDRAPPAHRRSAATGRRARAVEARVAAAIHGPR